LTPRDLEAGLDTDAGLAEWYCNAIVLERRPVFLLTHAETLFAFFMFAAGKSRHEVFWREVRAHARAALADVDADPAVTELVLGGGVDSFAKTQDRGVLGSMVDYAKMAEIIVWNSGGLERTGLVDLTRHMNRTPMSRIGMNSPEDMIRQVRRSG
jgi:hypothetical protein